VLYIRTKEIMNHGRRKNYMGEFVRKHKEGNFIAK